MGLFSWKTADTKASIIHEHSQNFIGQPVYLVQPKTIGENIMEDRYSGYGEFGGVDAYEWLAEHNIGDKDRDSGISLAFTKVTEVEPNVFIAPCVTEAVEKLIHEKIVKGGKLYTFSNWQQPIPELKGECANTLEGKDIYLNKLIAYPLKFSFDANAKYDELLASEDCINQGF
ncbi:MAG: hypothetical protein ACI936_000042 [Paraglaciecola sp.]|jgi:hypothetical protein